MKKTIQCLFSGVALLLVFGCAQGDETVTDKSMQICGDKPNCVSTLDIREAHYIPPFTVTSSTVSMNDIVEVAMTLPGARIGEQNAEYARIECVSRIMRFVDDLELRKDGDTLIVRSESRVGYSDFGVNRKRIESLREALKQAGLIQ
ncbi:DUF1499 domain-containing protein [Enterovibrio nigricans]|uniref:Uncharacterized conserved protein, DUF1499 family n=1 Tax=Enterovibrio nigricans DSM 22720 TaxID=1121868 RepID=A0A1T4UNQ2_9GAMM|nr:DUF1499 domain-containing protein [Enterovibrio nigricans]SKA54266.1 Uncharacterized conserved protein, DUF1499 family [Enterovibrio nigricans DSM 22720]